MVESGPDQEACSFLRPTDSSHPLPALCPGHPRQVKTGRAALITQTHTHSSPLPGQYPTMSEFPGAANPDAGKSPSSDSVNLESQVLRTNTGKRASGNERTSQPRPTLGGGCAPRQPCAHPRRARIHAPYHARTHTPMTSIYSIFFVLPYRSAQLCADLSLHNTITCILTVTLLLPPFSKVKKQEAQSGERTFLGPKAATKIPRDP